jgi:hypothetical protein
MSKAKAPKASKQAKSWRDVLPVHPAAELFPPIPPDELRELGEDIRRNGLLQPVTLWRTNSGYLLLDGRNRLDAMEAVGLEVIIDQAAASFEKKFAECVKATYIAPPLDPLAWVVSQNLRRRHLTAAQKRELIAKVLKAQPEKSDLAISRVTQSSDKTVTKVRTELERRSEIPNVKSKIDSKGRRQPSSKKKRRDADDFRREMRAKRAAEKAKQEPAAPATTPAPDKPSNEATPVMVVTDAGVVPVAEPPTEESAGYLELLALWHRLSPEDQERFRRFIANAVDAASTKH